MPSLSEADRRSLLDLARRTISEDVSHQKLPENPPRAGVFAEKRGVFVTLQLRGRLRGCIGVVEAHQPLGEAVVSLLSALEPIHPEMIEIGKHGLLISRGAHRGLLLPQVASEHQLNREQFLEETCRKAGLTLQAWQEPETRIFGFT